MKKLQLIAAIVLFVNFAEAQQKPYYTQYILNNYILNPALSGIENYVDVKLSYRKQWTEIPGSPQTSYFTIHGALNKSDYKVTPTSFVPQGENARGNTYVEDNVAASPHHGVGLMVLNDKTGYISRFSMYASYAYHMSMSVQSNLSIGFMAGFSNVNIDRSKIDWGTLDPNDPAVGYSNGDLKKMVPEIGAGIWYYSPYYFAGASVLNIVPGKAKFVKDSKYGTSYSPHFFASTGFKLPISESMHALPSVGLQYITPEPLQIHANLKFQYEDRVWFGGSYRYSDKLGGFAAMAGLNLLNAFNIGYSYDFSSNARLGTYVGNTHEIVLGFLLGNTYREKCPRCSW